MEELARLNGWERTRQVFIFCFGLLFAGCFNSGGFVDRDTDDGVSGNSDRRDVSDAVGSSTGQDDSGSSEDVVECASGETVKKWFVDKDGDGFGDENEPPKRSCTHPGGDYVKNQRDCDDSNKEINPSSVEKCDGVDNNCDGHTDGFRVGCPRVETAGTPSGDYFNGVETEG